MLARVVVKITLFHCRLVWSQIHFLLQHAANNVQSLQFYACNNLTPAAFKVTKCPSHHIIQIIFWVVFISFRCISEGPSTTNSNGNGNAHCNGDGTTQAILYQACVCEDC